MRRLFISATVLSVIFLGGSVYAQSGAAEQGLETASYYLAPVSSSGVSGNLQVTEQEGGSTFTVTLQGIEAGQEYALALFEGDCGPDRPRVLDLDAVGTFADDPYASITDTNLTFARLTEGNYFLYVYGGDTADTPIAACGEVGVGANASGTATPSATPATPTATTETGSSPAADNATDRTPGPDQNPRAASYALSPVENSHVSGNLQVSEQLSGGTRLTVSLAGIKAGEDYTAVLYQGDCGPDRPKVAQLNTIDATDGNPNSSVTDSTLGFDALTEGDHFLYIFAGEPSGHLLACGEVGMGANP